MPSSRPQLVLFTDLDGTLLSRDTYDPGRSRKALGICRDAGIPVVIVSSKTRAEIERIREHLAMKAPFISENGGGVYLPRENWNKPEGFKKDGDFWSLALGTSHAVLCRVMETVVERCGLRAEGFSSMSPARIMQLTGLHEEEACLAKQREFDEPFFVENPNDPALTCLENEARKAGLHLSRGGRFFHITGGCDKGKAVRRVMTLYRGIDPKVRFAAVGDAENDLPMLREADHPFLVRQVSGGFEKAARFDGLKVTKGIGPEGFYEVVQTIANRS